MSRELECGSTKERDRGCQGKRPLYFSRGRNRRAMERRSVPRSQRWSGSVMRKRERERERERERPATSERQRDRETERQRDRETEREYKITGEATAKQGAATYSHTSIKMRRLERIVCVNGKTDNTTKPLMSYPQRLLKPHIHWP